MTQTKYKQRPHIVIEENDLKVFQKENEKSSQAMFALLHDCLIESPKFLEMAKRHKVEVRS